MRILFCVLGFLSVVSWAADDPKNVDMKYCVQYVQQHPTLNSIIPIKADGSIDRQAVAEAQGNQRLAYTQEGNVETFKVPLGLGDATIKIRRRADGSLIEIQEDTERQISTTPHILANAATDAMKITGDHALTKSRFQHFFEVKNGKCFLSQITGMYGHAQALNDGNEISGSKGVWYDSAFCKTVYDFYKNNPDLQACTDSSLRKKLDVLLSKSPKIDDYPKTRSASKGEQAREDSWGYTDSAWEQGLQSLQSCLSVPTLSEIAEEDGLLDGLELSPPARKPTEELIPDPRFDLKKVQSEQ